MGVVSTGSDVFHSHVLHRIVITVVSPENSKDKKLELYIIQSTKLWEKKIKKGLNTWLRISTKISILFLNLSY